MKTEASLAGGYLAAFGATACCFGPLAFAALGFGGAWVAGMARLAPYQPIFIGVAVLFLGLAFHRLYLRPRRCAPGEACEDARVLRRQRIAFWVVLAASGAMFAFPYFAAYFY